MKKMFHGYYQPTSKEFKYLWENCIFVLDANVLLNLYRYSPNTRTEFFKILERISERLWIPHQVALEYQNNRLNVIAQQEKAYSDVAEILNDASNLIESKLNEYRRHPYIDVQSIIRGTRKSFTRISKELETKHRVHPDLITADDLRSKITDLFEGKVGEPYTPDRLANIYSEGEKRYHLSIPPGYMDAKEKKDNSKYGDLVLWFQILDKAKEQKSPVIFVCDDSKEDWWWIFSGKVNGPRPELIEEFTRCSQMKLYVYPSDRFMEFARDYFNEVIGKNTITEVKNVRQDTEDKRVRNIEAHGWTDLSITYYLKNNWKNLIELSSPESKRSTAAAILRSGNISPISIDGNAITLSCRHSYFKEILEEPSNKKIVENIISNFFGSPVDINIVLEQTSKP